MLSLIHRSGSIPIAKVNGTEKIYINEADEDTEPDIDTSHENKLKIFKEWLHLDKKLLESDIVHMVSAFNRGERHIEGKLGRKYSEGLRFVIDSLKRYLNFGKTTSIFPVVDKDSYRMSVSGLSGSGKTTFVCDFIKAHKPRKGAGIFLFSPIDDDPSLKSIKNLIHVDLISYAKQENKEFELEDMPEGSICLFDDIDSFKGKELQKMYQELRDICLQRGRHRSISTLTISHSPMMGHRSKATNMECEYFVVFPSTNKRDTATLLRTYAGYSKADVDEVLACKSRWVFVKKSIPAYWVSQHSVRLM